MDGENQTESELNWMHSPVPHLPLIEGDGNLEEGCSLTTDDLGRWLHGPPLGPCLLPVTECQSWRKPLVPGQPCHLGETEILLPALRKIRHFTEVCLHLRNLP